MMLLRIFISLCILLSTLSKTLTKYGTVEIWSEHVIFESKDFNEDEDMYFKVKTNENNFLKIRSFNINYDVVYCYCDSSGNRRGNYFYLNFKKTENKDNHDFGYFTITKRKSEHTHSNGDYIKIEFNLNIHWAVITNTEKDEGKIATWIIVVIVVAVIAIIAGIVIFFVCRCIRNRKAMTAVNKVAITNMAAQNQVYNAQMNQNAYIAGQNYQAQAYQAQVFQNPVTISPGIPPDTGYNSKAVM